ncbi:MAG TPA: hypothetical protein VMW50_10265 [Dehalococcoidia bacterium]|nr:hypothetical protein [Dehalococcoidia bacterium]
MKVRLSILNTRQPKCYTGNGLLIRSGHKEAEFDYLELAVIVRALSEVGMLQPEYLQKLKIHMDKEGISW